MLIGHRSRQPVFFSLFFCCQSINISLIKAWQNAGLCNWIIRHTNKNVISISLKCSGPMMLLLPRWDDEMWVVAHGGIRYQHVVTTPNGSLQYREDYQWPLPSPTKVRGAMFANTGKRTRNLSGPLKQSSTCTITSSVLSDRRNCQFVMSLLPWSFCRFRYHWRMLHPMLFKYGTLWIYVTYGWECQLKIPYRSGSTSNSAQSPSPFYISFLPRDAL